VRILPGALMLRITTPYFVAGIMPGVGAAPIIKYMVDWTEEAVLEYCAKRGWKVDRVEEVERRIRLTSRPPVS